MSIMSPRLPDDLAKRLTREAQLAKRPRSELARDAIVYHLDRLERERFLASMESAARPLAEDPVSRAEALRIAKSFLRLDGEALVLAEWPADSSASQTARQHKGKKS
jgi:hypothetical protein